LALISALGILLIGLLLVRVRDVTQFSGLLLVGFGVFLLYGSLVQYQVETKRRWLTNHRVHLTGRLIPPNDFRIDTINGESFEGRLFLADSTGKTIGPARGPARRLRLTGRVEWYSVSASFRNFLENDHYLGVLNPVMIHKSSGFAKGGEESAFNWVREFRVWLEKTSIKAPYSILFIQSLTTGERTFPNHVNLLLRRLGIVHLFVISGLHVGLLFILLGKVFSPLSRLSKGLAIGVVLIAYLSFLGWPVSAVRAGIMIGLGGISYYMRRRTHPVDILCSVFLILMCWDPFIVFDVGFQLSMSALGGILLILPDSDILEEALGTQFLRVNVGAFVGTLPVLLWHFQYVAPLGIIASYIAGILFPFFVVALGGQLLFLAVNWTWLHQGVEWGLKQGIEFLLMIFNEVEFVWGTPELSVPLLVTTILLVLVTLNTEWPVGLRLSGAFGLVILLGLFVFSSVPPHLEVRLIHDSPVVFLRTSDRHNLLVLPRGSRLNNYHVSELGRYLGQKGVRHLDYLISDYSRTLFGQFDADFTVERFVPYWSDRGRASWGRGSFVVEELQLQSIFTTLNFRSRGASGSIVFEPQGLFARSGDGRCLINNPASLNKRQFQSLKNEKCHVTFLREAPLVYTVDTPDGSRAEFRPDRFHSRVLQSVLDFFH
jgi:ComEC/Rec2-related protein